MFLSSVCISCPTHVWLAAKSPVGLFAASPPFSLLSPRPFSQPLELPSSEALIVVELVSVSADCPTNTDTREQLQIANIQFNNLDIIGKFVKTKRYLDLR